MSDCWNSDARNSPRSCCMEILSKNQANRLQERGGRMHKLFPALTLGAAIALTAAGQATIPRAQDGHPSFEGLWTDRTLTPLERRKELGTKEFYTAEEFAKMSAMLSQGKLPEGFAI